MNAVFYRTALPPVARYYLAAVAVLFLLAMSAHISLQRQSAEEASQLVHQLARHHHWTLKDVRLHMLRGILTVYGLHIQAENWTLDAPYVLLRGHFSSDPEAVRLREWHMQRGQLQLPLRSLPDNDFGLLSQLPPYLQSMMRDIRLIDMDEVDIQLMPDMLTDQPLLFQRTHLQWQYDASGGHAFATSQGRLGFWQWRKNAEQSSLNWQNVRASKIFPVNRHATGTLKGHMRWQGETLQGDALWQSGDGSNRRLAWEGTGALWKTADLHVHAVNWPVIAVPALSAVDGCQWQQGGINGTASIQLQEDGWSWRSRELTLRHIQTATANGSCLQAEELVLHGLAAKPEQSQLTIKHFEATHGTVDLRHILTASPPPQQHITAQGTFQDWQLRIDDDTRIGDLYGTVSSQPSQWQLALYNRTDAANAERAGQWQINASGQWQDRPGEVNFSLQTTAVPVDEFRRFFPQRMVRDALLSGNINLQWQGAIRRDDHGQLHWSGDGDAAIDHLQWQRAGWQAGSYMVNLDHIQLDESGMHVQRLALAPWQLLAPLVPLTQSQPAPVSHQLFWLEGWQIDELQLAAGSFAIGWPEPVWARIQASSIHGIHPGKALHIELAGTVMDGAASASIRWFPWHAPQRMDVRFTLHDALPFVANNWLLQSDIPDFIQGRIDTTLEVDSDSEDAYAYQGIWHIGLRHGELAQGLQQSEQFQQLVGAMPREALAALRYQDMTRLDIPLRGNWQTSPLSWSLLGKALIQQLHHKVAASAGGNSTEHYKRHTLGYVRLHHDDQLWPNERARVRTVIKGLHKTHAVVELVPQLGRRPLNADTIADIRYTQQLLEDYMVTQHIKRQRIFPLWPQTSHQAGGEAGIRMQVVDRTGQ